MKPQYTASVLIILIAMKTLDNFIALADVTVSVSVCGTIDGSRCIKALPNIQYFYRSILRALRKLGASAGFYDSKVIRLISVRWWESNPRARPRFFASGSTGLGPIVSGMCCLYGVSYC